MSGTVRLALLLLPLVSGELLEQLQHSNALPQKAGPKATFKACIDDSDCADRGTGFACFQYVCYPWADDSAIPKADRKKTCKSNDNCDSGLSCFRHHDRRQIHKGLCMEPITDCSENGRDDCKQSGPSRECCNGQYCCGKEYFSQLKMLPCVNHMGCKDLGYGNFCCPAKGKNSTANAICCNENPNPTTTTTTTTTRPRTGAKTSDDTTLVMSCLLGPVILILAYWQ